MTTLEYLKSVGAFVSDRLIAKDVEFEIDGEQLNAKIWVKKLSIGEHERIFRASVKDEEQRSHMAFMISEIVSLGEEGTEKIPFTDAYRLDRSLAMAMVKAIGEVNGKESSGKN